MHTQEIIKPKAAKILGIKASEIIAVTLAGDGSGYAHLASRERIFIPSGKWND